MATVRSSRLNDEEEDEEEEDIFIIKLISYK